MYNVRSGQFELQCILDSVLEETVKFILKRSSMILFFLLLNAAPKPCPHDVTFYAVAF